MTGAFQAHHFQPCTIAKTQPKSNHNKDPEAPQITNQITPTEMKAQKQKKKTKITK